jgi:hypothetical protein
MEHWSSGDTVLLLSTMPEREQVLDAVSRSGNRIAQIAIVAERSAAEMIPAPCLAGINHAGNAAKPRMPRFGTEQMRYMRSRPWRSRGPWFDNRAGARRRGRRADELVAAVSDDLYMQDGGASAGVDVVEADDVLLSGAPAWPILERMPAAWVSYERASALTTSGPGHDRAPQPIDQLLEAEAVFTAHMLSSQSDDSATSISSSRQSA